MQKERRLQVTVSPAMMVALDILRERSGLPRATQALAVMRSALDRTIHSAECQDRLRAAGAYSTRNDWMDARADDTRAELANEIARECLVDEA